MGARKGDYRDVHHLQEFYKCVGNAGRTARGPSIRSTRKALNYKLPESGDQSVLPMESQGLIQGLAST